MKNRILSLFTAVITLVLIVTATTTPSYAANAPTPAYVFNPATYTHNDDIDKYDTMFKTNNAVTLGVRTSKTGSNNSAYIRGTGDRHMYNGIRVAVGTVLPDNILSIYADPGVKFSITDYNNDSIAQSELIQNNTNVLANKQTTYSGGIFYYFELRDYTLAQISSAPVSSITGRKINEYTIEFYTDTPNTLHYSVWYGAPLLGESFARMIVTQSVTRPTTTSTSVTSSLSSGVPVRSWVKSINYLPKTIINGSALVEPAFYQVKSPSVSTPASIYTYSGMYYTSFSDSTATPARGTYTHNLRVFWNSAAATYTNSSECYVEYYYIFGSGEIPLPPIPSNAPVQLDSAQQMITGLTPNTSYKYNIDGAMTWTTFNSGSSGQLNVSSLISTTYKQIYVMRTSDSSIVGIFTLHA